jgi:TfoX/Sxy family transcriptional regulator of competence genes
MASCREYLDYVLEQLAGLDGISCRAMMGEYILYYQGKIFGGVYDDRFLVKDTAAARAMMPNARPELPYPGAKPMLPVEELDDRAFLEQLIPAMAEELPQPKPRRGRSETGLSST